jgi:hypothetical protein
LLRRKAHSTKGGTIFQRRTRVAIVRRELKIPLNRWLFTHPITPTLVTGGLRTSV